MAAKRHHLVRAAAPTIALALFACGGGGNSGDDDGGSNAPVEIVPGNDHAFEVTVETTQRSRSYELYVPKGADLETPMPLVLIFHGGGPGSPETILESSDMRAKADQEEFLVAALRGFQSTDNLRIWNTGVEGAGRGLDDVTFADTVISQLDGRVPVNLDRVYATGFSLGGAMTYRVACELSDRLAAVAVVSGFSSRRTRDPDVEPAYDCARSALAHPMPILHIHGLADTCVRYQGGVGTGINQSTERTSVPDTIANWSERNGCDNTNAPEPAPTGTQCRTRDGCDAGGSIRLCTIENQGHVWSDPPRQGSYPFDGRCGGEQTGSIDATDEFWAFVSAYRLSELSD